MLGAMQNWPLRIMRLLDHAEREHGAREIVSRWASGAVTRTDYAKAKSQAAAKNRSGSAHRTTIGIRGPKPRLSAFASALYSTGAAAPDQDRGAQSKGCAQCGCSGPAQHSPI